MTLIQGTQAQGSTAQPAQAVPTNAELKAQIKEAVSEARSAANEARAAVAAANGGVLAPPPPQSSTSQPSNLGGDDGIPPQAVGIAIGFMAMCAFIVIGWPIARAFGRRIERRGDVPGVNPAMTDQLHRIEQAVDAMSIEIERISESQRFMAKLQTGSAVDQVSVPANRV
jgi:hypothetical protein